MINNDFIIKLVVGKPGHRMVNFLPADEYLFGTKSSVTDGNEQGGIYARTMIGFRFEEWPKDHIKSMHEYFQQIQCLGDENRAKYSMVFGPIYNFLRKFEMFSSWSERGNCAYWTSLGLCKANVFNKATMWPKYACMKLYTKVVLNKIEMKERWEKFKEQSSNIIPSSMRSSTTSQNEQLQKDPQSGFLSQINETFFEKESELEAELAPYWKRSNFNIVTYRCSDEKVSTSPLKGWVRPFSKFEHFIFQQMDEMSNIVVEVNKNKDGDDTAIRAVPAIKEAKHRPFW